MIAKAKKIYRDALSLPQHERSRLASLLVSSLKNGTDENVDRKTWEREWAAEAERRLKRYKAGTSIAKPGDEVLKAARLTLKRASSKSHA